MPPAPAPLLAGRYRLGSLLGHGKDTSIHRAVDVATGRSVAVKRAKTPEAAECLRREYAALLALKHPHLPEVHELGADPALGGVYLARELVDGETLDMFVSRRTPGSLVVILHQLARALAFLHGRGVVHGDVKPANVLVRAQAAGDPHAILIDLGFALEAADPAQGVFRGTPRYSPERVVSGAPRGAVDDVYALARTALDLARPSELGPALTELLGAAVAEDPDLRPQDGRAFLARLERALPAQGPRPFVADPIPLIGRRSEMQFVESSLVASDVGLVLLSGAEGVGKSALLREVTSRPRPEACVVLLDCGAHAQDPSEVLVRELVFRPSVRERERESAFASLGRGPQGTFGEDTRGRGEPLDPLGPDVLADVLGRLLVLLGRRGGVLLVLDGFEPLGRHARSPLLALFERMGEQGIVGTTALAACSGPLGGLGAVPRARELAIGNLPAEDAQRLAAELLRVRRWKEALRGEDSEVLARRVVDVAGGHPGFLEALACALPPGRRAWDRDGLVLPGDYGSAVAARIEELPPDALDLLETLAVQYRPVLVERIGPLCVLEEGRWRAALDVLLASGIVHAGLDGGQAAGPDAGAPRSPGSGEAATYVRISGQALASRVRARLTPARAAELHEHALAALLVSRGSQRTDGVPTLGGEDGVVAAEHAIASGSPGLVAAHAPAAVRHLVAAGLQGGGAVLATRALDVLESGPRTEDERDGWRAAREALQLTLGDALFACGELEQALASFDRAESLALSPSEIVRAIRQQAECHVTLGRIETAERQLAAIAPGLLDALASEDRALLACTRARLALRRGNQPQAKRLLRRGLEELGDGADRIAAELWNNLGFLAFQAGDFEEAERWHRRALDARLELGDDRGVSVSLSNLAGVSHVRGRLEEARAGYARSLDLKRRQGNPTSIALTLSNLGIVDRDRGAFAGALTHHEEALTLREEVGDDAGRAHSLAQLAEVLSTKGAHGRARRLAQQAVEVAEAAGSRDALFVQTHLSAASVLAEMGDLQAAGWHCEQGAQISAELGLETQRALFEIRAAEIVLVGLPTHGEARARFADALEQLRSVQDDLSRAEVLWIDAQLALDRGEDLRAQESAKELALLAGRAGTPFYAAAARFVRGVVDDRARRDTDAAEHLHAARAEAERMGVPRLIWALEAALADFHERRGRVERASRWSLRCLESIRAELLTLSSEQEEVAFLGHPRRARALGLLARRARARFPEGGSQVG